MTQATDIGVVARATEAVLRRQGLAIRWRDTDALERPVSPALAASPSGLLPAFVVAGEAVWRAATGHGFALQVAHDPDALLGYRLTAIGAGGYAAIMLATVEAMSQAARGGALLANDLGPLWAASAIHLPRAQPAATAPAP